MCIYRTSPSVKWVTWGKARPFNNLTLKKNNSSQTDRVAVEMSFPMMFLACVASSGNAAGSELRYGDTCRSGGRSAGSLPSPVSSQATCRHERSSRLRKRSEWPRRLRRGGEGDRCTGVIRVQLSPGSPWPSCRNAMVTHSACTLLVLMCVNRNAASSQRCYEVFKRD